MMISACLCSVDVTRCSPAVIVAVCRQRFVTSNGFFQWYFLILSGVFPVPPDLDVTQHLYVTFFS
jgi:hypothetical protein